VTSTGQLVTKVAARDSDKPISTVVTLTPVPARSPRGLAAATRNNNIAAALEGLKAAAAGRGAAQGLNGATRMAPAYPASTPALPVYQHQGQQHQVLGLLGNQGTSFPLSAGAVRHPSSGGGAFSSPFSMAASPAPQPHRLDSAHLPDPFASLAAAPMLQQAGVLCGTGPQQQHNPAQPGVYSTHQPHQSQQAMVSSFAAEPAYAAAAAAGAVVSEPPLSAAFDLPDLDQDPGAMGDGIPAAGNSGHTLSWLPPSFGLADRLAAAEGIQADAGPGSVTGPNNAAAAGVLGTGSHRNQQVSPQELLPGQGSSGRGAGVEALGINEGTPGDRSHIGRPDVGSGSSSDRHQQHTNPASHSLLHNMSRASAGGVGPGSTGLGAVGGNSNKSRTFSDSLKGSLGWSESAALMELAGPGSPGAQGGLSLWSGPLPSPVLLQGPGPGSAGPLGSGPGSFPAVSGLASMVSIEQALAELGEDPQQLAG
jgi:hypothetical protein